MWFIPRKPTIQTLPVIISFCLVDVHVLLFLLLIDILIFIAVIDPIKPASKRAGRLLYLAGFTNREVLKTQ